MSTSLRFSLPFHSLPCEAVETVMEHVSKIHYRKGDIIFGSGDLNNTLYFIEQGLVRGFTFL